MFKCNFHAHSRFDDGTEELESLYTIGFNKWFQSIGVFRSAPVNFDSNWNIRSEDEEYTNTAKALKTNIKTPLKSMSDLKPILSRCTDWRKKRIDYTIGAVHFLKNEETGQYMPVDGNRQEFEETLDMALAEIWNHLFRLTTENSEKCFLPCLPILSLTWT